MNAAEATVQIGLTSYPLKKYCDIMISIRFIFLIFLLVNLALMTSARLGGVEDAPSGLEGNTVTDVGSNGYDHI